MAAAVGYALVPVDASATPGMVLGHVPKAAAPTSATIVVPKNAAVKGYATKVVTISQGGSLSVINLDSQEHTVTADAVNGKGNPLFDRWVEPGRTESIPQASKLAAGTYTFHCSFHPSMTGTLIVEGGSGGTTGGTPHFTLPLKRPPRLTGARIHVPMRPARERVLPTGPKTRMWTYGGTYPGPTIVRPAGHDTKVTFTNRLPRRAGAMTVHFHGDHHRWQDDGQPIRFLIRHGHSRTYNFPLTDNGKPETEATDFYHDHRMDRTTRNNWNGLQGLFLVHSKRERRLNLPSGRYDVPLMVTDRRFNKHNQLVDPVQGQHRTMKGITGPMAPPGDATVGNRILVDGRFAPHLRVAEHRYRLRLVNTSSFTSYDFALSDGRPFVQVGNGSGLLPHPVVRQDILLGPAQRADVVVDFSGELHQKVLLESIPRTHRPPSGIGTPTAALMQFRVNSTATDHGRIPHSLANPPPIRTPHKVSYTWKFGLAGTAKTGTYWTVNGKPYNPRRVDVEVPLGATRKWKLTNLAPITHYIHLHEEQWHTISRDGKRPPPWERGLEDTWRLDPGESVVVAAHFTDYPGVFMLHCHMLNHEDDGMMAQFAVVRPHQSLPRGYHLAATTPAASRPAMGDDDSMSMLPHYPLSGWHRAVGRFGDAMAVDLLAMALLFGLRAYWKAA
jgi:FtsP/CotA-like multicopper oxidase with cupredoxin domain/plastocyanin